MQKKNIEQLIISTITKYPEKLSDQEAVAKVILNDKGINIPQSTISRHMKKMGISKVNGFYRIVNEINQPNEYIIQNTMPILSINIAPPNLMVVHTKPGYASSIASKFDESIKKNDQLYPGLLGTIAGDDTILLIVDPSSLHNCYSTLNELLTKSI